MELEGLDGLELRSLHQDDNLAGVSIDGIRLDHSGDLPSFIAQFIETALKGFGVGLSTRPPVGQETEREIFPAGHR
jgi:hypothetical protein